jgi:hypothetical protein
MLLKLLHKIEMEGIMPNLFYEVSITLIPKLIRTQQKNKIYRQISWMNIGTKFLNQRIANQTQQYIKKIICHDQT